MSRHLAIQNALRIARQRFADGGMADDQISRWRQLQDSADAMLTADMGQEQSPTAMSSTSTGPSAAAPVGAPHASISVADPNNMMQEMDTPAPNPYGGLVGITQGPPAPPAQAFTEPAQAPAAPNPYGGLVGMTQGPPAPAPGSTPGVQAPQFSTPPFARADQLEDNPSLTGPTSVGQSISNFSYGTLADQNQQEANVMDAIGASLGAPAPDAGPDAGPDTAPDAGPDAGPDGGSEGGGDENRGGYISMHHMIHRADGGIVNKALEAVGGQQPDPLAIAKSATVAPPVRQLSPMGFYSHGAETAAGLQQAKGTPQQYRSMLEKGGVKPAELEGFNERFANRPHVTREEVAQHFKEKMPQIEETVLGGKNRDIAKAWETVDRHEEALADAGLTSSALQRGEFNPDLYPPEFRQMAREYADAKRYINEQSDAGRLAYNDANAPTKFSQYTLPGGENYREVLLKMPATGPSPLTKEERRKLDDFQHLPASERTPEIRAQEADLVKRHRAYESANREMPAFRSSHWDDPNVLAHLRMADRTGPNGEKILHVEEIQSDWGQKGREEGFYNPQEMQKEFAQFNANNRAKLYETLKDLPGTDDAALRRMIDGQNDHQIAVMMQNQDQYVALQQKKSGHPTAPYVTNTQAWTDLALKRALREAAEGGYDKLVWTPGAEQAKRYSLSNQVDRLQYIKNDNGTYAVIPYKNGEPLHQIERDNIPEKELESLFGRDVAEKMRAYEGDVDGNARSLSGQNLEVGGSGMKGYYDKIVPNQLSKLVKKLDPEAKIGQDKIVLFKGAPAEFGVYDRNGDFIRSFPSEQQASQYVANFGNGRGLSGAEIRQHPSMSNLGIEVPSLTITPKMRENILKGQTAFKRGGSVRIHPALNIPGVHIRTAEAGEPIFHGEK